jgi:hypothetical protein
VSSPEGSEVMRVRTELVLEQLVSRVLGRALELRSNEPPPQAERVLESGPEPTELARLGYVSRIAETEMFEPARRPMPWLAEMLAERGSSESDRAAAIGSVSLELAGEEPEEKPDPGQGSWRVPGPGGHVRHYLALASADEIIQGDSNGNPPASRELSAGESKRCFLFGFYARCCEEATSATSS